MRPQFEAIAPTFVWKRPSRRRSLMSSLDLLRAGARMQSSSIGALVRRLDIDLVYLNTLTVGDMLEEDRDLGTVPVVSHVHELPMALRRFARGGESRQALRSDVLISVSDAVASNLVRSLNCPAERVRRIYGFVPSDLRPSARSCELRETLLRQLGLPGDSWIVGFCGFADLRKGVDLVVPLARLIPATIRGRPVQLIWVGGVAPDFGIATLRDDVRKAEVADRVHFVGATSTALDWMSTFDVHALLSREDPFPLVVLEAAALGVPTVCFSGAGGAPEFVRTDAGAAVPYLDVRHFAELVGALLSDDSYRNRLGDAARLRVQSAHTADATLPEVATTIFDAIARSVDRHRSCGRV